MTEKQYIKTMTEEELQKACEKYLKAKGIRFLHLRNKAARGRNISNDRGWPDLMIYPGNGEVLFIELKRDARQELRPEQLDFRAWSDKNGYQYAVLHDLETFEAIIEKKRIWKKY